MKSKLRLFSTFLVVLAFPLTAGADLELAPLGHDFGDVKVGSSSTTIITITSPIDNTEPYYIDDVALTAGGDLGFSITLEPPQYAQLLPGQSADVEVTFTPGALGYVEATLTVVWSNGSPGSAGVDLGGVGVDEAIPPAFVEDILLFFDASVGDGPLYGKGPGSSASHRLKALRNQIEAAGDIIGDGADACQQLSDAYQRCEGLPRPPDFAQGPAAPTLAGMILDLMASLGCE